MCKSVHDVRRGADLLDLRARLDGGSTTGSSRSSTKSESDEELLLVVAIMGNDDTDVSVEI